MLANRMQQTVRMSILSVFIALMAFSFLAMGTASAHTVSNANRSAQSVSSSSQVYVHIISRHAFNPTAVTVKSGTHVKIVNKATISLLVFYNGGSIVLAPGQALLLIPTQSQSVVICAGATLTITVV